MTVGIVVVSHSAAIAGGVVDLARQMAPDVAFAAAGGTDDGGIGTSFDEITAAVSSLADDGEVVVLCDLGSAYLTVDTVLDFLDEDARARVEVSPAPLVEGTIAAAVAAQAGGGRAEVLAAAATAFDHDAGDSGVRDSGAASAPDAGATPVDRSDGAGGADGADAPGGASGATRVLALVNASGLHARPAAEFVKTASSFDAAVRVNGVDAKSLLAIMAMGLGKGSELRLEASGADASAALDALTALVESGFGEE